MSTYGYMRVSSKEQNEGRQLAALLDFGIERDHIYLDKQSGKDFERNGYRRLLRKLHSGDLLVVKSIDRLGRNYTDILDQWSLLTKKLQVDIVILDMPLLDTRRSNDLTGTLIADIVLQLLSYVAENERENIRSRQAEGIAVAKENGVHFGRPRRTVPPEFVELYGRWRNGMLTLSEACSMFGCSRSTFFRYAQQLGSIRTA